MEFLFFLSIFTLIVSLVIAFDIISGYAKVKNLNEVVPLENTSLSKVSVVVAARNEEKKIKQAALTLLDFTYPDYEIIIVNDRSEDGTGDIISRLAADNPKIKQVNITRLPEGWLGKNHALHMGATHASGEIILFTDADVVFKPDALTKGVSYLIKNELAHLCAFPKIIMPGIVLKLFAAMFVVYLSVYARPWKARDPKSYFHMGVGAYNMVWKSVYDKLGGHEQIKMRPDDDIKFGRLIKKNGFRQDVLLAKDSATVEWYSSIKELVNGLTKNSFAAIEYNIPLFLLGLIAQLLFNVFPFIAPFITEGTTKVLYLLGMHAIIITVSKSARKNGGKWYFAIGYPFMALLFIFIQTRTVFLTLFNRGLTWRNTKYSIDDLKRNKV